MRIALIALFFCLSLCCLMSVYSQIPQHNLKITYIATEGFLLESSTHKVLIDALFSEGLGYFAVPPQEVIAQIMDCKVPFDNINVYLLTHYHMDHCDPKLINEYLSKHPDIPFVASKPSIVFIDGTCFGFIAKKKQFKILTPNINHCISDTINNIPVKVLGLKHLSYIVNGIDLEENMFNVSYLFEMDGIKIFHSGDADLDSVRDYLIKNTNWPDSTDIAFLNYFFFTSGESDLSYLAKALNPKYIILTHVPPSLNQEWQARGNLLRKKFPNILFFVNSMDSLSIKI